MKRRALCAVCGVACRSEREIPRCQAHRSWSDEAAETQREKRAKAQARLARRREEDRKRREEDGRVVAEVAELEALPRPRWWPPPCETCRGFGYVVNRRATFEAHQRYGAPRYGGPMPIRHDGRNGPQTRTIYERCPDCRQHPGHAWSHEEQLMIRMTEAQVAYERGGHA